MSSGETETAQRSKGKGERMGEQEIDLTWQAVVQAIDVGSAMAVASQTRWAEDVEVVMLRA